MSFQANRRQSQPDDGGYALPIVIVVIAVGAMVAVALLGYAAALLRAGEDDADSLLHLYAADAGINRMRDQLEEEGPGSAPMEMDFMFDGIKVTVSADPVTPHPAVPLHTIVPWKESKEVVIRSVPRGVVLEIRWATTTPTSTQTPGGARSPTDTSPRIEVYGQSNPGAKGTPTPIATSVPCPNNQNHQSPEGVRCPDEPQDDDLQDYIGVYYEVLNTGEFRIRFDPGIEKDWSADSCPNEDEEVSSFCITAPDYVVISKAGDTTVTAYIHQILRWLLQSGGVTYELYYDVEILSWKPYPPDEDDDP